jgi:hypothetical protein
MGMTEEIKATHAIEKLQSRFLRELGFLQAKQFAVWL